VTFPTAGEPSVSRTSYADIPFEGFHTKDGLASVEAAGFNSQGATDGFRLLHKDDYRYEEYLEQFRDVLEACPAEPLYRKDS